VLDEQLEVQAKVQAVEQSQQRVQVELMGAPEQCLQVQVQVVVSPQIQDILIWEGWQGSICRWMWCSWCIVRRRAYV